MSVEKPSPPSGPSPLGRLDVERLEADRAHEREIAAIQASAGEYEAGQRAVRKEMATDDRAYERAGSEPSQVAVQVAGVLRGLLASAQIGTESTVVTRPIPGVPTALRITGLRDGRQVIVHVMEVNR